MCDLEHCSWQAPFHAHTEDMACSFLWEHPTASSVQDGISAADVRTRAAHAKIIHAPIRRSQQFESLIPTYP